MFVTDLLSNTHEINTCNPVDRVQLRERKCARADALIFELQQGKNELRQSEFIWALLRIYCICNI